MQADKFVKEGDYKAALEAIAKARQVDPTNPYAIAYEERVRTLMQAQQKAPTQTQGQNLAQDSLSAPHLEKISKLAIEQEQTSAAASFVNRHDASMRKQEEEQRQQQEERRQAAIRSKISTLLSRAQQYLERGEFGRALDELSRALLLDPQNSDAHALEQNIRAAHDEANKQKEAERVRRAEEEERQRQEQLHAELERLQREQTEQRVREEAARHNAQKQKVDQYLQRSRELLAESRIQDAQNELTFVVVIDPLNEEAKNIARQIQMKKEQLREADLELRRKKEEEERKKREAVLASIRKHIDNAKQLASTGAFSEALRVITRAYVLDPINEELQECENTLIAAQEEAMRSAEAKHIAEEEHRRQAEAEARRQREQEERERFLHGTTVENEERKKENQEGIHLHLTRAESHMAEGRFEGALSEVALAFLIDPFHEDVKNMEQRVLAARAENHDGEPPANVAMDSEAKNDPDSSSIIADHIAKANQLRDQHEYARALDELAKAFILDPLSESVQKCEDVIQKEFIQFQLKSRVAKTGGSTPPPQVTNEYVVRATEFASKQLYDEALAEIALGLAMHPDDKDLHELEQSIWGMKSQQAPQEARRQSREVVDEDTPHLDRLIKIHLLSAEEFVKNNDYGKALDELAKAFLIDPLNGDAKKMEHRVRLQQSRQQKGAPQPLKLVYRGDKAAEG